MSKKNKFSEFSNVLHVAHSIIIKLQETRTRHQIKAYRAGYNIDKVNNDNDDDNNIVIKKKIMIANSFHSIPTILLKIAIIEIFLTFRCEHLSRLL